MNTETPIEISFAVSEILQTAVPQGYDSTVYIIDINGTQVTITSRSARDRERMYLKIYGWG